MADRVLRRRKKHPLRLTACFAVAANCVVVVVDSARAPYAGYWLTPDRVFGSEWASKQPDLTGLLVDDPTLGAGGPWFDSRARQLTYNPALLSNPIIRHVRVPRHSHARIEAVRAGFEAVFDAGTEFVVLRKRAR